MEAVYFSEMSLRVILVSLVVFFIWRPSCVTVTIWLFLGRPHMQL
jgi:hypothetical protein